MTEVGVPTPEEEQLGRRVFNAFLDDTERQAALWILVYEIFERMGAAAQFETGAVQVFCGELYAAASSRPEYGFVRYSPPRIPPPGPPPA